MNQKSIENSLEHCLMKTFSYKKEWKNLLIVAKYYGMIRLKQGSVKRQVQCAMNA